MIAGRNKLTFILQLNSQVISVKISNELKLNWTEKKLSTKFDFFERICGAVCEEDLGRQVKKCCLKNHQIREGIAHSCIRAREKGSNGLSLAFQAVKDDIYNFRLIRIC